MTKTLLVTGASSGIGAAVAELAAEQGWDVLVHYNSNRDGAEDTASKVQAKGQRATVFQADLSGADGVKALFADIDAANVKLDGFINNSGAVAVNIPVMEMTPERIKTIMDVNLLGPFLCAAEASRRMARSRGGHGGVIVNISSMAAELGSPNTYVDYAAAKAGIDMLTKGLGLELAADGVRVAGVRPGVIDTPIHGKGGLPDRATDLAPSLPMKRSGSAREVAEAVMWLASDKASYVTGTTINVSGGR